MAYLTTSATTDTPLKQSLINIVQSQADIMVNQVQNQAYPVGAERSGWASSTGQGWTSDVMCMAYRLTDDTVKKQVYFNAINQLGDYSLGLNALSKVYVTGLGTNQPNSPLHLDSWYTLYGKGDHEGTPLGNVPGIPVFGPTVERSGAAYQQVISNRVFPVWEELPTHRRYADGWSLVNSNEFTTWENTVANVCMQAFLNQGYVGDGTGDTGYPPNDDGDPDDGVGIDDGIVSDDGGGSGGGGCFINMLL